MALDLPALRAGHSISAELGGDVNVLVVAGTVSKASQSALTEAWEQLPEPRVAIAYGVCASSGGPYWDSYSVTSGAAEFIPIQRFVPGCPPPRDTLIDAVVAVAESAR